MTEHVLISAITFPLFQRIPSRENNEYLENGGAGSDVREGGLNATGGIDGESSLNEFPLELIGGRGGAFKIAGILLGGPLATGAPTDEGENSHCLMLEV